MRHEYEAFGERKTMRAWCRDSRCPVSIGGLRYRILVLGMTVEQAFAASDGVTKYLLEGFGERKSLHAWSRDPRCRGSKTFLRHQIVVRGMTIEQAFAASPPPAKGNPEQPKYEAFGERKTLDEWSRDPRCRVSKESLRRRILVRGMTVDQALVAKPGTTRFVPEERKYEAFGERKSLHAWSRDPRCPVSATSLSLRVLARGMTVEQAFTVKVEPAKYVLEAFGERKSLHAWACDPRCPVSMGGLRYRILDEGMTIEQAFAAEGGLVKHILEGFGERKALNAWGRDPRCPVSRQALHIRVVKMGLTIEEAFALGPRQADKRPGRPPGLRRGRPRKNLPPITAWGETKTPEEWATDPRARVRVKMILDRLRTGYTPEQAISMSRYTHRPKNSSPAPPAHAD